MPQPRIARTANRTPSRPETIEPVPDPTSPSKAHADAVSTLRAAVEKADGTIGHSEILSVVNTALVDLQGTRDVLI